MRLRICRMTRLCRGGCLGAVICDCCGKVQLVLYDETGAAFAEATLPDELIEQVADHRRQRRQAH